MRSGARCGPRRVGASDAVRARRACALGGAVGAALHRTGTRLLTGEPTRDVVTAVLAAAGHRPELARVAREFFADRLSAEGPVFERARRRGELAADADPAVLMDLLGGAIWFRLVIRSDTMAPADAAPLVRTLLSGAAAR